MQIWLNDMVLPVTPGSYQVTTAQGDQTLTTVGLGEILLTGKRSLKGISFDCFFPNRYDRTYCQTANINAPMEYVKRIEQMAEAPVKLIITGTSINMMARIQSFDWGEDDGTGDVSGSLSLKEYRSVAAGVTSVVTLDSLSGEGTTGSTVATDATRAETQSADSSSGAQYTVKKGDTLSGIARKKLGAASKWPDIYQKNKSVIGGNPDLIYPGQVLILP